MSDSSKDEAPEPIINEISEVKMFNPNTNKKKPIKTANFEGITDIFDDNEVQRLRDEDWFTRGIGAKVEYRGRIYKVTVAGNSRMGYVKVEDVEDVDRGRELHRIMRDRFLDYFRVYPKFREESEYFDT